MNDLKSLHTQLDGIRAEQAKVAAKLGELGAERHEIETAASQSAAAVAAAEQDLVDQLARHELGEQSDPEGARQRLDAARALDAADADSATRVRVLDTLRARFDSEHQTIQEKAAAVMAQIAAAEVEVLRQKADQLREDALEAMRTIARVDLEVPALRRLCVERGGSLEFMPISQDAITHQHRMSMMGRNVAAEIEADLQAAA